MCTHTSFSGPSPASSPATQRICIPDLIDRRSSSAFQRTQYNSARSSLVVCRGSNKVVTTTTDLVRKPRLCDPDSRLPDRDRVRQRPVRLPVQRADRRRLGPVDDVVLTAQPTPAAEVCPPVGLVQPADETDTPLLEQVDSRPVGGQAVGQDDVARGEHVPQPAEQADFTLSLAGVPAESEVHDRSARQ